MDKSPGPGFHVEEAKALLDLAKQLYPAVVPDIEKAIAAPRDS
jgi:hypothetical protein